MTGPTQDPTPWELLRAVQQLRDDLRADFAALASRLEHMVTKDVYAADQRAVEQRIGTLEGDLDELREQREREAADTRTNRRLALSALVAPVVVALLVAVLLAKLNV
ncbi:hypothetical protein [Streptomyces sp. NBC_01207]|uniref:hypothetical protein n=1 Tax=Streptomyces sp. NBC_01207 TaxID=2903772 RepID=UPI002E13FCA6|nr:hypothetical protein OG457_30570 [Streptomyces sp. NBC_01207]